MPLPEGVERITITDSRTHPDGGPMRGRVILRPAPTLVTNPAAGHTVQGDAEGRWINGELSLTVLAADADGYDPTGYTHTVMERPDDAPGRDYPVLLTTALGPTIDLATLAPTEPYLGDYVLVPGPTGPEGPQGPAGADGADGEQGPPGEAPTGDTVGVARTVAKPVDESVTASTTLQDDDHLTLSVTAGGQYAIDACLIAAGDPAADLTLTLTAPPGSTGGWTPGAITLGVSDGTGSIRLTRFDLGAPAAVGITAAGLIVAPLGTITAGANGTITVQWAQNVATATPTIVRAGSWLRATRVA
ncbi:collagen-like protein [Streptomyces sp. ISL-111]|uniref:collagen-like protein n=1 Tax=Streptomyces sp. ISL-111 TaxID=2819175 RepID=UPI001BE7E874|nr:collagen-like protein [Streptomyces sp. ISL-111]MBT2379019.1 collagen-like protein [Streptomyces sp. ISL-111]